ncbi:MAG TPA: hypothetical protein VFW28_11635 [Micropepsaceae bacterium]|nr:hypothetical protein [Micropepsaceae bacterium]
MRFWDSSAIVPLLVAEAATQLVQRAAQRDPGMMVWWGSRVECISALARQEREKPFDAKAIAVALGRLKQLSEAWHEIEPSDMLRETAIRFLQVHALRAADALQLAAAFAAAEGRPPSLEMITLDERLAGAARKEGFLLTDTVAK